MKRSYEENFHGHINNDLVDGSYPRSGSLVGVTHPAGVAHSAGSWQPGNSGPTSGWRGNVPVTQPQVLVNKNAGCYNTAAQAGNNILPGHGPILRHPKQADGIKSLATKLPEKGPLSQPHTCSWRPSQEPGFPQTGSSSRSCGHHVQGCRGGPAQPPVVQWDGNSVPQVSRNDQRQFSLPQQAVTGSQPCRIPCGQAADPLSPRLAPPPLLHPPQPTSHQYLQPQQQHIYGPWQRPQCDQPPVSCQPRGTIAAQSTHTLDRILGIAPPGPAAVAAAPPSTAAAAAEHAHPLASRFQTMSQPSGRGAAQARGDERSVDRVAPKQGKQDPPPQRSPAQCLALGDDCGPTDEGASAQLPPEQQPAVKTSGCDAGGAAAPAAPAVRLAAVGMNEMPPVEKLKRPLRLQLSDWIAHAGVVAAFAAKGVTKLYPWQAAALECGEDGHNLVYCAPTSGGKSLVAEVLMIRRLVAAVKRITQVPRTSKAQPKLATPRALLVLPYVSIVSEKAEHLTKVLAPMRARVRGYTGAEQTGAPLSAPDEMVAVVTMEKANSTVNRLIAEGRLGELCCVVVDEAHMVGDPQRGICLELCLTKLRFAAAAAAAAAAKVPAGPGTDPAQPAPKLDGGTVPPASTSTASAPPFSCQLVCMSATMSGLDDMCGWLGARLFMTNFRPVPLTEYAVFKGKVFRKLTLQELQQKAAAMAQQEQSNPAKAIDTGESDTGSKLAAAFPTSTVATVGDAAATDRPSAPSAITCTAAAAAAAAATAGAASKGAVLEPLLEERDLSESGPKDPDRLAVLVAEVAREGHSVLVFCSSRAACQGCAGLLASLLPKQLPPVSPETYRARRALLADLQDASGGYLSAELQKLVEAGVAYHHAGLTSQERSAVERGFRAGLIHTLTATSTLAAGINLPARRVILRSLWQGIGPVSRAQYLQMIGRAGRAGQSTIGEAFLIGKGAPHTLQGEWRDVCRLMTARLPPLRCCLLDSLPSEEGGLGDAPRNRSRGGGSGVPNKPVDTKAAGYDSKPGGDGAAVGKPVAAAVVKPLPGGQQAKKVVGGAGTAAGAPADAGGETHLQRMLLEAIANGSVSTGANVEALIRSTLLYQQAGYEEIAMATHNALTALRQRRLVTFSPPPQSHSTTRAAGSRDRPGPGARAAAGKAAAGVALPAAGAGGGAGALWQPTQMGRAIYESCLPTATGQDLYDRLDRARGGLALEGGLHLLFLLMAEPLPVEISNWEAWARMLERMPREPNLRVAEAVGVKPAYAQRLLSGRRGSLEESALHCRFASACLLQQVMSEGDIHELEQAWGVPGELTQHGIPRGQLQKLQGNLSKWAGMAAVMAGSCGWWALQALLESLSQQAAAGTRPELLPLMVLSNMTGARARGLYASGITKPSVLAVANEEDVRKALESSLPRALRQQKPGKGTKESAVAAAAAATSGNALIARGARALIQSARQYMSELAARVAQEEAGATTQGRGIVDEEAVNRLADELRVVHDGAGASATGTAAAPKAGNTSLRGSARITELSDASRPEALEAFLQAWRTQTSFAVAVVSTKPLELGPELRQMQQQQLGVVVPGAAGMEPSSLAAVGPDGARPSAVNTAMMVPGPPTAAVVRQRRQGTQTSGCGAARRHSGAARAAGGGGCEAQALPQALLEGLVVCWNPIEAVVLTFRRDTSDAPSGEEAHGGVGAGAKRKPDDDPLHARPLKLCVTAPTAAGGRAAAAWTCGAGGQGIGLDSPDALLSSFLDHAATGARSRGGAGRSGALWRAACEVLGSAGSSKVCWHAEAQLAALLAAGCDAAGQWDDPRVMAWLAQGTAGPQEINLQELQRCVLPSYAVRVPLQQRAAVTAACRTALVSWAVAAPLRGMLAAGGVASHYRTIEAPLTLALARTRLHLHNIGPPGPSTAVHRAAGGIPGPSAAARPAPTYTGPDAPATSPPTNHFADAAAAAAPARHCAAAPSAESLSSPASHPNARCGLTLARGGGGLILDEPACRAELARALASRDACQRLVAGILRRPVDLTQPTTVAMLCSREFLVRSPGPALAPDMYMLCPVGRRPPHAEAFYAKTSLPPRERARADVLGRLLTRSAAAVRLATALQALLAAVAGCSAAPPGAATEGAKPLVGDAGSGEGNVTNAAGGRAEGGAGMDDGGAGGRHVAARAQAGGGTEAAPASAAASAATATATTCTGGVARFAMQRVGMEGRLGYVFGDDALADAAGSADGVAAVARAAAADGVVLVTELSSAPVAAPSMHDLLCGTADWERHLQGLLPLPVLFLDVLDPEAGPSSWPNACMLRAGLLLEVQGPSPRVALEFGPEPQVDRNTDRLAVVAVSDALTRQPVRLGLPASRVWCARTCCTAEQCLAAAQAGQLMAMATPQVLRSPAEELLRPPAGWTFVTVLYPYLHLAVVAHCTGDERLVEALYQPQPWAAVAATWGSSQAGELRRLQLLPPLPAAGGGAGASAVQAPAYPPTSGLCCPPPLELAARQVVSRVLLNGCSHKELAAALGLRGGDGGRAAAAALVTSFLEAFPGVAAYREELTTKAKKDGHVALPSGHRIRPLTRQLNAGGVAAGAKLQRLLGRLQMGAAAAEVVRTAAALALTRLDEQLQKHYQEEEQQLQRQQRSLDGQQDDSRPPAAPAPSGAAIRRPDTRASASASVNAPGVSVVVMPPEAAAAGTAQQGLPNRRVSLVWCGEAKVALCVPQGQLSALLGEVQEAASRAVMTHLGLRVPLHVSIYHGQRLGLPYCEQYVPDYHHQDQEW